MWKKMVVGIISLIATFSVVYAMNQEMSASPSVKAIYYGFDEEIAISGQKKFKMGGWTWGILYADQATGEGYIMADNIVNELDSTLCAKHTAGTVLGGSVSNCMINAKSVYTTNLTNANNTDAVGKWIMDMNGNSLTNVALMTFDEYKIITQDEANYKDDSDLNKFLGGISGSYGDFWLDLRGKNSGDNIVQVYYYPPSGAKKYTDGVKIYNGLACAGDSSTNGSSTLRPVFKVKLPRKDIISNSIFTSTSILYEGASSTAVDAKVGDVEAIEGEGPYTFTIETGNTSASDVLSNGSTVGGVYPLSNNFTITPSSTTGSADLKIGTQPLVAGTYYVKVKVHDASTNLQLYVSSTDSRRDKTVLIKLDVIANPYLFTLNNTPQNQASYEYLKNVSTGSIVGEVRKNSSPMNTHYEIVGDGDNTFQNFEINGLDANGNSALNLLQIAIKNSGAPDTITATNSLKAGTYKYCVQNSDPNTLQLEEKVCTSITVNKTTPTISFNTTAQKDMKIGDPTYTGDITYSNKDTIVSSDITYSLSGGVPNMLTVTANSDPTKYDAEVIGTSGTGLPTTFTVSATIKETENYKSATTTISKAIYVYKALSGLTWTASKGSYTVSDVTNGKTVGSLLAVDGVGPYTYALAQSSDTGYSASDAANNASFQISGTDVITSSNLLAGTYKMQFKVTDARGDVKLVTATITVTAQVQASLDFKDKAGGSIITSTGITIKYDDTNKSLLADGGSTTNPIEYYLADPADQPSSLVGNAMDYLDVAKIGGLLKPKKVGEVLVYAKRPGDSNFGDVKTGFMKVKIEPAPQTIAFNSTTNPSKVEVGKDLMEDAKGTITSSNATGIGGITYKSSDPSIAAVDANGKVTGVAKGSVIITATLNDSALSNTSHDPNYETKTCTKTVNVYIGMNVTWTAATPNLKAEFSVSGDKAGSLQVTNNSGNITYTIVPSDGDPKNADSGFFQVINNGQSADIQLNQNISAAALAAHTNQYHIQVAVKDGNGTQIIDVVITIDDATNNAYFTENGSKVTAISKKYGENSNTFQLTTNTSNAGNVTYSLPSNTTSVITVSGTGKVDIKGVGTETVQAVIAAGSGYDGTTITIPVTITAGDQTIAFVDTSTVNHAFTAGATFKDDAELKETTAQTVSARTITYASTTPSVCLIDQAGTITMKAVGSCTVTAENAEANWQKATTSKTINLYSGMGVSFTQSNTPQAETSTAQNGSPVGSLTVSGGQGSKTYAVSTNTSDPKNKDASFFSVNSSGVISLAKAINASDIASYYDSNKKAYIMHVQFDTKDSLGNTITTGAEVTIKGAPLNAQFDTGGVGKITKVYSPNGTFTLNLSSNAGNGTPTYQLKNDPSMPSDVLKPTITSSGVVTIDNANDKAANANPVMVEAMIPPYNGYDGETIEAEVEIIKAPQPNFGFQNTNIQMQTSSTVTPIIKGKLSSGKVTLTSSNNGLVAISGNDLQTNTTEGSTAVTVIDAGDRNYQAATGTATVTVSAQPAYGFIISVPSATYGDTGLSASIILNGATGANQKQTWSISDPTIADIDASGNITIYKAGSVDITCTQTSTGEPSATHTVTMVIKPKPITITINDKSKYVGEAVPTFDMTIPSGVLVGSDTISLPTFTCVDSANALVANTTPAGSYPITGSYTTGANPNYNITVTPGTLTVKQDASLATWYHLEGATSGNTLDPTKWYNEDVNVVLDPATETAGTYDEFSLDKTLWSTNFITVTNEDENKKDVYFRIDASDPTHPLAMSTPQATTIKIDKTKPVIKSITGTPTNKDAISTLLNKLTFGAYFNPGTKVSIKSEDVVPKPNVKVSGVSSVSYEVYEIDKATGRIGTTPKETGTLSPNANGISEFTLNDTGLYRVCAISNDHAGNQGTVNCSDLNVKNINIDNDGDGKPDNLDPDNDGCPDINIALKDETDSFYKINVDRDGDNLPDLNIDSDGDGKADINVDTDKDGKPDLNLLVITKEMWKPTFCVTGQSEQYCTVKGLKPTINVDVDGDGIPDIDIDNIGDFKPHLNISKDGKTPAINIVKLHEWKPGTDYKKDSFEYDSIGNGEGSPKPETNIDTNNDGLPDVNVDLDGDGKEDINIDTDGDGIPDVDIDGDGDGIPDINIDTDKDGKPDKDVIILDKWDPVLKGDKDGFIFGTGDIKRKDELEDGGVIIGKPGGAFLPNFAIKVTDVTEKEGTTIKDKIKDIIDDQVIKNVLDVNLWKDGTQVQPDGTIRVKVPVDATWKNPSFVIELEDGTFKKIDGKIKDGYFVYDTDYLGKLTILSDDDSTKDPTTDPDPTEKPGEDNTSSDNNSSGSNSSNTTKNPDTSVKGAYTSNATGGALTGDSTDINYLMFMGFFASGCIVLLIYMFIRKKLIKGDDPF